MDDVLFRNKIINALNSRSPEMLIEVIPNISYDVAQSYIHRWISNYDETRQSFISDNFVLREYKNAEDIIQELFDMASTRSK